MDSQLGPQHSQLPVPSLGLCEEGVEVRVVSSLGLCEWRSRSPGLGGVLALGFRVWWSILAPRPPPRAQEFRGCGPWVLGAEDI